MKLKQIYHEVSQGDYPNAGNAWVPKERPPGYDQYGFNSLILITGRSHPDVYSQAGRFYKAYWRYDVDYDRDAGKQVGLKISINISGYLSNDKVPPDISWAGLIVTLEQTFPGPKILYKLERQSNKQPGSVSEHPEDIIIKPLLPHPADLWLELNTTCNVVLDRDPSSTADHESHINITLKPFTY
jgi:hypothetical protein